MNVLEIKFFRQPVAGMRFRFRLQRENGTSVYATTYTLGSSTIGATLALTVVNIAANLNIAPAAGFHATAVGNSVFIEYTGTEYLSLTNVIQELDYFHLYYIDVHAQGFAPFNIDLFSVEVIDMYENTRTLVEHFSKKDTVNLTWDGGDALYQPMMASSLDFSMQVPAAVDGYFLHLLTGDEKRYFVRLKNHDTSGGTQLLWQGFVLPDLYKEPYKNGALFVDFTAVDMLASLKGKTFAPWFYWSSFTLPELLGYILAETGLQQEMYVKIAFENYRYGLPFSWREMNLSLKMFTDGEEYDDLYTILESVLQSQGLQIVSYRGKWILQGFTRRQEASGIAEVYYPDGVYKESITLDHEVVNPLFNTTPTLTAETPFKKVAVNFETDTGKELFTEGVVVCDYFATRYRYDADRFDIVNGFVSQYQNSWAKIAAPMCRWSNSEKPFLEYGWFIDDYPSYQVNEAVARVNYFECREKPYVKAGRRFTLNIEAEIQHYFTIVPLNEFLEDLNNDTYNNIFLFQVFLNGREFLSNRPGWGAHQRLNFTKTFLRERPETLPLHNYEATYSLSYEFVVPEEGVLSFRFLPAFGNSLHPSNVSLGYTVRPTVLKITAKDDVIKNEGAVAARPINYTQVQNVNLPIVCTPDTSLQNNFGYGVRPLPRYADLGVTLPGDPFTDVHYKYIGDNLDEEYINTPLPGNYEVAAYLNLTQYRVERLAQDYIFRIPDANKSVFLLKENGVMQHFVSLYAKSFLGRDYIASYNGYTPVLYGLPFLPEDYTELPAIETGDKLMMMFNLLATEDESLRELWKIYGFTDYSLKTYAKTMAYAYHCTRPTTIFSLDATALKLIFPLQRVLFRYLNQNRFFLPVRYKLNLFGGKTELTMKEAILTELNDVSYE